MDLKRIGCLVLSLVMLVSFLSACQAPSPDAQIPDDKKGDTAVVIESLGKQLTYDTAPERVVALGYDLAEELAMLGLADKIVAVAPCMYLIDDVKPEYRDKIGGIPVLPDGFSPGVPTLETVLSQSPDFVLGYSYSFSEKSCGKVDDYIGNNINFYATEGTYVQDATIDTTYSDFMNLGKIFRVEEKATALVEDIKAKAASIAAKIAGKDPVPLFVLDGGSATRLYTIGGVGFQNSLIEMAGGKNIFSDVDKDFADVSMEELVARDPEAIVIIEYYSADLGKEKIAFLESTPELQDVKAVKDKKFIVVSGYRFFPCGQNLELVEQVAMGLHPGAFE